MSAGGGFGAAALILAVIGAFTPVIGLYIGWAALALATLAALAGARGWAIAVVSLSAMVFLFLTPSLWLEAVAHNTGYGVATGASPILKIGTFIALGAPIVSMLRPGSKGST